MITYLYLLSCPVSVKLSLWQNAEAYQDLVTSSATDQAQLRETTCPGVHPFQPEISVLEDTKSSSSDLLQNPFQTGNILLLTCMQDLTLNNIIIFRWWTPLQLLAAKQLMHSYWSRVIKFRNLWNIIVNYDTLPLLEKWIKMIQKQTQLLVKIQTLLSTVF